MGGCGLFTTRLDKAVILMHAFTRSLVHSVARLLVRAFVYFFLHLQNRVLVLHLIAFSCPH